MIPLAALLVGVAGALVAAELTARYLEPALPMHRLWYDALPAVHLRRMREVRAAEGGVDVVFCGSSVIHSGFDPDAVVRAGGLPLTGYNAALHRGFHAIIGPWLEYAVIPILRPRVLVIGVSITDINDNGALLREEPELYRRSLLGRPDVVGAIARRLEPHSALFRNHRMLARPATVFSAMRHRRVGTVIDDVDWRDSRSSINERGHWTGFYGRGFLTTQNMFNHVAIGVLGDYDPAGEQLAIIERSVLRLKELVPQVVLTTVPFSSKVPPVLPQGERDLEQSHVLLRALAARIGVPLLEPEPDLDDERHFADIVHCNEHGTAVLSRALGVQLGELLTSSPRTLTRH